MKKPIISLKTRSEKLKLLLCLVLTLSVSVLFFLPREALCVFANGKSEGVRGLFNIINGWL